MRMMFSEELDEMKLLSEKGLEEAKKFKELSVLLEYLNYLTENNISSPYDCDRIECVKAKVDELLGIEFDE